MSDTYLGQVVAVAFNFAPIGWAMCDGSLLQIAENDALFALLGTTYGGDGQAAFALPDLRGRIVLDSGQGPGSQNYLLGEAGGVEHVTLASGQVGAHTHHAAAASAGSTAAPGPTVVLGSAPSGTNLYATAGTSTALATATIAPAGGSHPHENRQPFTTLSYIIATSGVFPSRN